MTHHPLIRRHRKNAKPTSSPPAIIKGIKMNLRIVTDSTCDLPEETVNRHGITVIPLNITQGNHTYLDGVDLTRDEFYAQLPSYRPAPRTATPGPDIFHQAYERLAEKGAQAILSIHISEKLSHRELGAHGRRAIQENPCYRAGFRPAQSGDGLPDRKSRADG
jgi:hypothetical protein